jgi:hypothetical protein
VVTCMTQVATIAAERDYTDVIAERLIAVSIADDRVLLSATVKS